MKTLIVVDMQKDFIDGALGTAEAVAIKDKVREKIKQYLDRGDEVIFTRDTHSADYMNTHEGSLLPVLHCVKDSDGWQIPADIDVAECRHIDKPAFGYTGWDKFDFEEVELVGLCTDICVVSNALILRALFPEINISVDSACCAGVSPETHKAALATMGCCQIEIR